MDHQFHIGVDENGLGARLGPLVVTGVLARSANGRALQIRKRAALRQDIDDSKRLVAHGRIELAEAWARVLTGERAQTPAALFEHLSLEGSERLRQPCPARAERQCWGTTPDSFSAEDTTLARLRRHLDALGRRGVEVLDVRSSVVCTRVLNDEREVGKNRFTCDLHAMEHLLLFLRERAQADVNAVCGKVGGIADYSRYFGPLSQRLHAIIELSQAHSGYHFPGLGEVHFVKDADAKHLLVMLASLVGKYVRELLMGRISYYYGGLGPKGARSGVSGYNDPLTKAFIVQSLPILDQRKIPRECFERAGDTVERTSRSAGKTATKKARRPRLR